MTVFEIRDYTFDIELNDDRGTVDAIEFKLLVQDIEQRHKTAEGQKTTPQFAEDLVTVLQNNTWLHTGECTKAIPEITTSAALQIWAHACRAYAKFAAVSAEWEKVPCQKP